MRIIEKPEVRKGRTGPKTTHIKCDDGRTYQTRELAAMCDLSEKGLLQRLRKKGWDHPNILCPRVPNGQRFDGAQTSVNRGTEEWQQIIRRGPKRRIEDVPGPGILEQRYL